MFTLITNAAKDALLYINTHTSSRISFTRYEVGMLDDSHIIDRRSQLANTMRDPNAIFISNTVVDDFTSNYNGESTEFVYSLMDSNKMSLKMAVPAEQPYFKFNAVVVYAKLDNNSEFPFLVSYSLDVNPKLSTTVNRFGMRYYYIVQLELRNRDVRLDLSNIEQEAPDFSYFDEVHLPRAYNLKQDQVIVNKHQLVSKDYKIFAVESLGQHWGIIAQPWEHGSYSEALVLDGEQITLDGEELILATKPQKGYTVLVNDIEPPLPWGSPATYMFLLMGL